MFRDRRRPERVKVGAKSPGRAIAAESVEERCSSAPDLEPIRRLPSIPGNLGSIRAVVPTAYPAAGMFERSVVVLVETCYLQKPQERARPGAIP